MKRFTWAIAILMLLLNMALAQSTQPAKTQKANKESNGSYQPAAATAVTGSGTGGRLSKWAGTTGASTFVLGDSNVFEDKFGKVGIGTTAPTSPLTVRGMIETTLGGYKFPDGTVQTTAGLASVFHNATLTGNGTAASPLGVAIPLTLVGEAPFGSALDATNTAVNGTGIRGAGGITGIFGKGFTVSDSGNSGIGVTGIGGFSETTSSDGGIGVLAAGGSSNVSGGGSGVEATGGNGQFGGFGVKGTGGTSGVNTPGGIGVFGIGGNAGGSVSGGTGVGGVGGTSPAGLGGTGVTASGGGGELFGGFGLDAFGGRSNGGDAGAGIRSFGGGGGFAGGAIGNGGQGIIAVGGEGNGAGKSGGDGLVARGGQGVDGATAGRAGVFRGDVQIEGALNVTGTKNFKIDHPLDPENKYLSHAAIESAEVLNVYSGNVKLDASGEATVKLPEWFEALNKDFRYSLTPIGAPGQGLYIAEEVSNNQFKIAGGLPGAKVSWQVTGVRADALMLKHPFKVEEAKSERERGTYLNPEAYGQPEARGSEWVRNPEVMQRLKQQRLEAAQSQKQQQPTHR